MTLDALIASLASALLVGIVFIVLRARERRALEAQVAAARATQAVAESRFEDLCARHATLAASLGKLESERLALLTEQSRLSTTLEGTRAEQSREKQALQQRIEEQKTWIEEQMRFFEEKVAGATSRLLEERGRAFTEVNRKEIEALVAPFNVQLTEFRSRIETIYTAETGDRSKLHQQIEHLTQLNQSVSKAAEGLTNALTISSKATGDWGETILKRILEDSGLREGREYSLQHSIQSADGARQQPDAVIFLPENRHVIVDSKVSNKAWKEYCDAREEAQRAEHLAAHLASLRAHIKGLATRDYTRSPDLKAVEFVLMFVPVEAALLAALSADDSLYGDAYRSKIVLVTPSTLMAVVKLVEGMWVFQNRKESAEEIAEAGRKLYEKLYTFSKSFIEIGESLEKSQALFAKARDQLTHGRGSAIKLAEQMRVLGVNPSPGKLLPPELTEADPED
jgi:DNA recombination protein RmuC